MNTTKISISHYRDTQELSYTTFPVTAEGLEQARQLLATKCANRYRYTISAWQFEQPYGGQLKQARELLEVGDVAGLEKLLKESAPRI